MKLLVITPILYSELDENIDSLYRSYNNLRKIFCDECIFLMIVQSKTFDGTNWKKDNLELKLGAEVVITNTLNVSIARNLGIIKSKKENFSHVIFHDCSLFYSLDSCVFLHKYAEGNSIPKVKVSFSNKSCYLKKEVLLGNQLSYTTRNINPIYDPCIGAYIFKVKNLTNLFDESLGPGSDTYYKSGEDVLFLFSYFFYINSFIALESNSLFVKHPPRPLDFSKHLLYAEGQGYLFRNLLFKYTSIRLVKDLFLFFLNGIFRVIMLRKNSLTILKLRFQGFFCKNHL